MPRKRAGNDSVADEFAGTDKPGAGTGSGVVTGASEPIEPDAAAGLGGSSGGSGGNGSGGRDAFGTEFDPAIHSGERTGDGAWAKRRGRKRGGGGSSYTRARASSSNLKDAVEGLTKTLVIVHAGIAAVSKTPELEIDEQEGKMLAAAAANVMEEFDLKPDPKTQAIVGLIIACGTVYGPRAVVIQMRRAQERAEKAAGPDGMGTAGVYDGNGMAQGTTAFHVQDQPVN